MDIIFFKIAFAGYSIGNILYMAYLLTRRDSIGRTATTITFAAMSSHIVSVITRAIEGNKTTEMLYLPWNNIFESLSLFALVITAIFLLIQLKHYLPILGTFIMPLTWLALTTALLADKKFPELPSLFKSNLMLFHVLAMFISYAAFANAFGLGIAYLIQERQIKSKRPAALSYSLPSLEELEKTLYSLIAGAFPVLTAGIILGAIWANDAWGRYWGWDPKETWSLVTWLVYLVYFHMRFTKGWRGRKTVYLSLAGFTTAIFTYIGINYISKLHGFLQ